MATAKAGPRKTSRTVTLKLTEGEADLLLALVSASGGHPTKSPRKYAERIRSALEGVLGYRAEDTDAYRLSLGNTEFFDYDNHPEIGQSDRILAYLTSSGLQTAVDFYDLTAEDTGERLFRMAEAGEISG